MNGLMNLKKQKSLFAALTILSVTLAGVSGCRTAQPILEICDCSGHGNCNGAKVPHRHIGGDEGHRDLPRQGSPSASVHRPKGRG
jgi:hypothetical protein